ncbi:unnamed protein product [Symbiodinium natans]|uniref:Calcineurin-like phosphoesterase domain-containing protein n=1 Tax=Symbiodinium natans TaxID=878477 RepID=A0A812L1A9_9DINO|nr:unnamed protein product [Symbiodinium natans]
MPSGFHLDFRQRLWLLLLRLRGWWQPWQVEQRWSETTARVAVRQVHHADETVSVHFMQISDSHITLSPLSGRLEAEHGKRMHDAFYGGSPCLWNGSIVQTAPMFRELVDVATSAAVDAVVLSGDIVSFPQASAVDTVSGLLNNTLKYPCGPFKGTSIPYVFTSGNHDWFFEGMPGSQPELQKTWRASALHSLYASSATWREHPGQYDFSSTVVEGVLLVIIDNSRYQVSDEQLAFFRGQMLRWLPTVLVLHVPLSLTDSLRPHRGFVLCGDPAWGQATDRSWRDEGRDPWPKEGNDHSTELFLEAVQAAAAPSGPLLAVLTGHTHGHDATVFGQSSQEADAGKGASAVQYICEPSMRGGHRFFNVVLTPTVADTLGATLDQRMAAHDFLLGLTWAALKPSAATEPREDPEIEFDVVWRCWGGIKRLEAEATFIELTAVADGIDAVLHRTTEALRTGLFLLSQGLRRLLKTPHNSCQGKCALATCETCIEAVQSVLHSLVLFADPPSLSYSPGLQLEVKSGCPMLEEFSQAIWAWQDGDWAAFGFGLGKTLLAANCSSQWVQKRDGGPAHAGKAGFPVWSHNGSQSLHGNAWNRQRCADDALMRGSQGDDSIFTGSGVLGHLVRIDSFHVDWYSYHHPPPPHYGYTPPPPGAYAAQAASGGHPPPPAYGYSSYPPAIQDGHPPPAYPPRQEGHPPPAYGYGSYPPPGPRSLYPAAPAICRTSVLRLASDLGCWGCWILSLRFRFEV